MLITFKTFTTRPISLASIPAHTFISTVIQLSLNYPTLALESSPWRSHPVLTSSLMTALGTIPSEQGRTISETILLAGSVNRRKAKPSTYALVPSRTPLRIWEIFATWPPRLPSARNFETLARTPPYTSTLLTQHRPHYKTAILRSTESHTRGAFARAERTRHTFTSFGKSSSGFQTSPGFPTSSEIRRRFWATRDLSVFSETSLRGMRSWVPFSRTRTVVSGSGQHAQLLDVVLPTRLACATSISKTLFVSIAHFTGHSISTFTTPRMQQSSNSILRCGTCFGIASSARIPPRPGSRLSGATTLGSTRSSYSGDP